MPQFGGPNTVSDSIVFLYDTGDTSNSYKGQPITNQFSVQGSSGFGSAADNVVAFPIQGTPGFIRLGYGQTFGGYTIQPNDVVYRYNLNSYVNGCHYHGNTASIPAGAYLTFTVDYYISPDTNLSSGNNTTLIVTENYGGGALGGSANMPNYNKGVWQTVTFTVGPTGGSGTQAMFLYPGGCGGNIATNGYILFRNPQVVWLNYTVPFVQGTRSTTTGLLDISGNSNTINLVNMTYGANNAISFDGTDDRTVIGNLGTLGNFYSIECVFNSTSVQNYRNVYDMNYSTYNPNTGNVGPRLEQFSDGTFNWVWSGNTSSNSLYNATTPTSISANTFYHTVFTLGGGVVNTYKNGALINSNVSSPQGYITTFGDVNVGRGFILDPSRYFAGRVPVFKIYNRTLTATEVTNNYLAYKTRFNLS
jgi:hypothetical protein